MNRKTLLLIIFLAFMTLGLFSLAYYSIQPATKPSTTPTPQQFVSPTPVAKTARLYFVPDIISSTSTSAVSTADVWIDAGSNMISGVQLEMQYNPDSLQNVTIKPATGEVNSFFAPAPSSVLLFNEVDSKLGRISYAIGISTGVKAISGKGRIATITFARLKNGQSESITFLPSTQVTQPRNKTSVLKEALPLTIQ